MDLSKSVSSIVTGPVFLQFVFALIANSAYISPGMSIGFSAVALPQLQNENATFHIDDSQASWTASIFSISTLIGCLLNAYMVDQFGRKATLLTLNIPFVLGWLLIALAGGKSTLCMIYAGRFLTGLANGMANVATVYTTEMSTDSFRGMFTTWISIAISLGILLVFVSGCIVQHNWRLLAGISAIFPACSLVLTFLFLPETPSWLLSKGKTEEAEQSLKKIRGISKSEEMTPSVQNEFQILRDRLVQKSGNNTNQQNIRQLVFRSATIKPFIIINLFFFFQQFSGVYVVVFYAVNVVKEAGVIWDPYLVTIVFGLARLLLTIAMSFFSKMYGRRSPAIISGVGMTISMGTLAIFLYLQSTGTISEDAARCMGWFPFASLMVYILTSTIGFLTLPWAMVGEVFPSEVRGAAASLTTCFAFLFNFIVVKLYSDMLNIFGKHGVFFFYGVFSAIGTVFVILFLPETEGKSLQEIEESFSKDRKNGPSNVVTRF